jgi:tetratricopeptide (TPR) repeat protein
MGRKSPSSKASGGVPADAFQAVQRDPSDDASWDAIDEAARQADDPDAAAQLYREILAQVSTADLASRVGQRAVAFHDEWFEDTAPLIALLERVLSVDPSASWAFERLSLLFTMAERWSELLAQYDRALAATQDASWKASLLDEASRIAKDFAGDVERANEYLKQLVLFRPEDAALAAALERRLEQQGKHLDLIQVWQARLSVLNDEQALATRVRIAERYLDLGDVASALERGEALLGTPHGSAAAVGILERIAALSDATAAQRTHALRLLRDRYVSRSQLSDAIRVLELWLTVAGVGEKATLHEEVARWLTESDQPEAALEHTAALLQLTPESSVVLQQLHDLARRCDKRERAARALVAAQQGLGDGTLRAKLALEAAAVYEELTDNTRAIELHRVVLADQQSPNEARLTAARRLSELLDEPTQGLERLEVLTERADLEDEVARREVLGQAADLAESLGQMDRALNLWERCLTDVRDEAALSKRIAILARGERWAELIGDLRRRVDWATEDAPRRADLISIAQTQEQRLGDPKQAVTTWQEIEELWGPSVDSETALLRLFEATNELSHWVKLLERIVDDTQQPAARRLDHLGRLGDVLRQRLSKTGDALQRYRQGLDHAADDATCRAGLQALLDDPQLAGEAAEILAVAYERTDDFRGLLSLVELRVTHKGETAQRDILLQAATLSEVRLMEAQQALGYLCRAFSLDPEPSIEKRLLTLTENTEGWPLLVQAYSAALPNAADAERRRQLWWAQGRVLEERLTDFDGALVAFTKVVELQPADIDNALAVVRVASQVGDTRRLAWTLVQSTLALGQLSAALTEAVTAAAHAQRSWVELCRATTAELASRADLEPQLAHDLKRLLANWYQANCNDLENAELTLQEAAAAQPAPDTLRQLVELQRRHPSHSLVDTLLSLADASDEDVDVLREAAEVGLQHDATRASGILERTLLAASRGMDKSGARAQATIAAWCVEKLVELSLAGNDPARAIAVLERGIALPFDRNRRVAMRFQAAQVAARELGDADRAIEFGRLVLKDEPLQQGALDLLSQLYEEKAQYAQLMDLRFSELSQLPSLERRLELRLDQARIAKLLGAPSSEQVTFLEQNLGEAPGHPPSVDGLAALLEELGDLARLQNVLNSQARVVAERDERDYAGALWARAGEVAEKLGDAAAALTAYRHSIEHAPTPQVLDRIAALHLSRNELKEATTWLEQRLQLTPHGEERRATSLQLANTLIAVGQQSRAEQHLAAQLTEDPNALELRNLLSELYAKSKSWALLAPLLTTGAKHVSDTSSQIAYLKAAADIHRLHLRAVNDAIPLLERAVALDSEDKALRLTLGDALREAGRHQESRQLLSDLLEEFGRRRTPEKAAVHYGLAKAAQTAGDLAEALEQLEAASSIQQGDPAILKLLGDVARQKGELERAERAYRTLLLLIGRGLGTGKAGAPFVNEADAQAIGQSAILFELHRIAEEMGQTERAKDLLDSALEAAAADPAESKRLENALRDAGKTELLLHALEQHLRSALDAESQAAVLSEKADLLVSLNRSEEALQSRLLAVSKAPDSAQLLAAARGLADSLGKTTELYQTLQGLAQEHEARDPALASSLWFVLGNIAEHESGGAARATECYRRALATGVNPLQAFQALDRIAEQSANTTLSHEALLSFANADQATAHPMELATVHQRLASIEKDKGNTTGVSQHLERALEFGCDPKLIVTTARQALDVDAPAEDLLAVLERAARAGRDDKSLLFVLQLEAKRTVADLDRLREGLNLARTLGETSAQGQLLAAVVKAGREQLKLSLIPSEVLLLSEQLVQRSRARDAAALLDEAANQTKNVSGQVELQLRRAQIVLQHLAGADQAARILERLQQDAPDDARVLKALAEIYREQGSLDKLEALLTKAEASATTPDERNALRLERARLLVLSGRGDEAEQSLLELLSEGAMLTDTLELLAQLYQSQGRNEELRDLLARQLELAQDDDDPACVAASALRLAQFQAVFDPQAAVETLQSSLHWTSTNPEVLKALLEYYPLDDTSDQRAEALELLLMIETPQAAPPLIEALLKLHEARSDQEGVRRTFELGARKLPDDQALLTRSFAWYEQQGDYRALAEAMAKQAERQGETEAATAQVLKAASLYAEQCSDAQAAAELLERAVTRQPHNVLLINQLAEYLNVIGQPEQAMIHIRKALEGAQVPSEVRASLLHLRAALRVKLQPDDMAALDASVADLDEAGTAGADVAEDLATLLDTQRSLASQLGQQEVERNTTLRLARILPQIDQAQAGLNLLVAWIRDYPADAQAVTTLGDLAAEAGKWGAATKAYQRLVEITTGPERIAAALRLADACEAHGIGIEAKPVLEQVYQDSNGDPKVGERLCALLESIGAYQELAQFKLREVDQATDNEVKFQQLLKIGALLMQAKAGASEAADVLARALEFKPADHTTTVRLAEAYVLADRISDATALLEAAIAAHGKKRSPQLSELQQVMAHAIRAQGDDQGYLTWLDTALTTDRQNGAAASELASEAMDRGAYELAIKALQSITLLKDSAPMSRAEAYLRQGIIAKEKGDLNKALVQTKRALATDPNYADAKAFLAKLGG